MVGSLTDGIDASRNLSYYCRSRLRSNLSPIDDLLMLKPFKYTEPKIPEPLDRDTNPKSMFHHEGILNLIEQVADAKSMNLMEKLKGFLTMSPTEVLERQYEIAMHYDMLHNNVWNADIYNGSQALINVELRKIEMIKMHYKFIHDYTTKHGFIDYLMYPYPTSSIHNHVDSGMVHWRGHYSWYDLFNPARHDNKCLTFGYDIDFNNSFANLYFHYRTEEEQLSHETKKHMSVKDVMFEKPPHWFMDRVTNIPKSTDTLKLMYEVLELDKKDMEFVTTIPDKIMFP